MGKAGEEQWHKVGISNSLDLVYYKQDCDVSWWLWHWWLNSRIFCYKVTSAILVTLTILNLIYPAEVIVHSPITCFLTYLIKKKSWGKSSFLFVHVPIINRLQVFIKKMMEWRKSGQLTKNIPICFDSPFLHF